ncbi:MAG TPA: hypothetical protein VN698_07430 [Bacteroidia bacterium]|nr:hypothetical protein [Bacteroidia bacterium]
MKNKLNLFTFCALSILLAGACSKNNTTTSGGGGNNNTTTGITPSSATSYYGILTVTSVQSFQPGGVLYPATKFFTAYFSNTATAYLSPSTFVKVDSVGLNGRMFKFSNYSYQDSTMGNSYPSGVWTVKGLNGIPSFTYTASTPIPTYAGYGSLPDTIYKSQTAVVPITGVGGSDQTTIILSDGNNGAGHLVAQTLTASGNSVTFAASTLGGMNVSANATTAFMNVHCVKNNVESVNGKPINFTTEYQLTKYVVIKP